jgi:alpha-tubulin suppressor-like RCC1 family protein
MGLTTGFRNSTTGVDIGQTLVEKSYLIDRYPELADTFKQAGLWLWGGNQYGSLGDNTITDRSSPVQTIASGTNWKQIASGASQTNAAIKTNGTLWLWGSNGAGALGDNSITDRSSPVQTVSGGTNWKQVACSTFGVTGAIKTDGTLWLWGQNGTGRIGDNTSVNKSSPVQTVAGGTNWKQLSCGGDVTVAIKTDGTLWTWGFNATGQLGNETSGYFTMQSSPVQTVSGGTNWKSVSTNGQAVVAAIKTDGTLWTWGYNAIGQLGDNTRVDKSSPVQTVAGGTNWKQVAVGSYYTMAIKTDGTLWAWGSNGGNLGDNTQVDKSSPVQTVAGGTNWKQVSASSSTAAIKTDGTLWTWGGNGSWPIIGDNTTNTKSSPVQTVAGGTNWKSVEVGGVNVKAIRDDSADIFGNPV